MKKLLVIALAIGLLAPMGCNVNSGEGELAPHNFPIINGETASGGVYEAVVSLHQRSGDSVYTDIFCSGTLIAPDVVLTAAHCLDEGRRKPRPMSPDALAVGFGANPTTDTPDRAFYAVSETWIHPDYNSVSITNDIGLVRLAVPNNDITPVPALPAALGFTGSDEGNLALDFVGFGYDETNNINERLHFVGVLDHIESPVKIYYYQNIENADGGPCSGDSGGPAFVVRNGTTYVGGMTSYGDASCDIYGVSSRADAFEGYITDFIGTPPVEPVCGDDACNGAEDCSTCPGDCGVCPPEPICGDDACNGLEDCSTCPEDCGACPACLDSGAACSSNSECCSGKCHPVKGCR